MFVIGGGEGGVGGNANGSEKTDAAIAGRGICVGKRKMTPGVEGGGRSNDQEKGGGWKKRWWYERG